MQCGNSVHYRSRAGRPWRPGARDSTTRNVIDCSVSEQIRGRFRTRAICPRPPTGRRPSSLLYIERIQGCPGWRPGLHYEVEIRSELAFGDSVRTAPSCRSWEYPCTAPAARVVSRDGRRRPAAGRFRPAARGRADTGHARHRPWLPRRLVSVIGTAWRGDTAHPIRRRAIRLRNVETGRGSGAHRQRRRRPLPLRARRTRAPIVVELVSNEDKVLAIGDLFSVTAGGQATTFVRLSSKAPWVARLLRQCGGRGNRRGLDARRHRRRDRTGARRVASRP